MSTAREFFVCNVVRLDSLMYQHRGAARSARTHTEDCGWFFSVPAVVCCWLCRVCLLLVGLAVSVCQFDR